MNFVSSPILSTVNALGVCICLPGGFISPNVLASGGASRHLLNLRPFGDYACDWVKINENFPRENATTIFYLKKRQICIEKHSEVKISFFGTKTFVPPPPSLQDTHSCLFGHNCT